MTRIDGEQGLARPDGPGSRPSGHAPAGRDATRFDPSRGGAFEARPDPDRPWIWHVWDIEHPALCNHFPVIRVDSKGASEDLHEDYARLCAAILNVAFRRTRDSGSGSQSEDATAAEAEGPQSGGTASDASPDPHSDIPQEQEQ